MPFIFQGSSAPTLGVEIELQILNAESLDLSPHAPAILSACKTQGLERVNSEIHQSMVEVNSEISQTVEQCGKDLRCRLLKLEQIVESQGLKLAVTGTHPFKIGLIAASRKVNAFRIFMKNINGSYAE